VKSVLVLEDLAELDSRGGVLFWGIDDLRAGDFPGWAPQKTQILTIWEEEEAVSLGLLFGFKFERPGVESSESRIEGAGEAPPDAMMVDLVWVFVLKFLF